MALSVRRLVSGDERVLEVLALEDVDFDIGGRGRPRKPLGCEAALAYLADPNVLHWIAEAEREVLGHLQCSVLRKSAGDDAEVLLYEIGVRSAHRRHGVGRALMDALEAFMKEHVIAEAWVLADNPGATEFYRACGFEAQALPPTYMTRALRGER
jgi:ribosomal protein S18 acetylase RimI-like enzyme